MGTCATKTSTDNLKRSHELQTERRKGRKTDLPNFHYNTPRVAEWDGNGFTGHRKRTCSPTTPSPFFYINEKTPLDQKINSCSVYNTVFSKVIRLLFTILLCIEWIIGQTLILVYLAQQDVTSYWIAPKSKNAGSFRVERRIFSYNNRQVIYNNI